MSDKNEKPNWDEKMKWEIEMNWVSWIKWIFRWEIFVKMICSIGAITLIFLIIIKIIEPSSMGDLKLEYLFIALIGILFLPLIIQFEGFGIKVELRKKVEDLSNEIKALPDYILGDEYYSEGDFSRAEQSYKKSLSYLPNFCPAILGLAEISHETAKKNNNKEEYSKAILVYNKVIEIDPINIYALNNLADIFLSAPPPIRDTKKALEKSEKAIAALPSFYEAHYYKAEALNRLGDYKGANDILQNLYDNNFLPSQKHWVMYELFIAKSNLEMIILENDIEAAFKNAKNNNEEEYFLKTIKEEKDRFKKSDYSILEKYFTEKNF